MPAATKVSSRLCAPFIGNPYEGDYNDVEKEKLDLFAELIKQEPASGSYAELGSERQAVPTSRTAAVVNATQTNQLKQRAFADDVQVAKNKAPAAFSLEGQIGMTMPVCRAAGII